MMGFEGRYAARKVIWAREADDESSTKRHGYQEQGEWRLHLESQQ